ELGVPHRELDGHLAAQAVRRQVVRRRLHEPVEVLAQVFHEVSNVDRLAFLNAAVQRGALVGEEVRRVYVEVAAPGVEVAEPGLRLLREGVDEGQRRAGGGRKAGPAPGNRGRPRENTTPPLPPNN